MTLDDESEQYIHQKLYRSRGKCAIYACQSDVYVELKQKSNAYARTTIPAMAENANSFTLDIGHDAWFQIAMHLDPEDVQTFALLCKQTAKLVSSRVFWRNMYKRYCLGSTAKGWNLELPAQLQLEQIRNCDTKTLRAKVIEALYHCYSPLKARLELGYSLDWLLHRTFMSCSQKQYQCLWVICYALRNQQATAPRGLVEDGGGSAQADNEVVNDWEALAEDAELSASPTDSSYRHEGVVLLIVLCRQFVPLPLQLLYNQQQSLFRLKATREMLCTDMRAKNLELDFIEDNSSSNSLSVTVKYSRIEKYNFFFWWHPDFKRFLK
ncbi:PREDICTED: transmembrane protein 183 [Drosophila arizonae]|uniref:Transmembrane protein 183 n=1 Tax=Drosophila arizonae TaxID=7263 RepID=A0ABM1PDM8_DROAR|nr:PREDICTED: transmembrane protein 183 [Drosophila arizonae]